MFVVDLKKKIKEETGCVCENQAKLGRVVYGTENNRNKKLGEEASVAEYLAGYDKIGGYITHKNQKVKIGSFYDFEKGKPRIKQGTEKVEDGTEKVEDGTEKVKDGKEIVHRVCMEECDYKWLTKKGNMFGNFQVMHKREVYENIGKWTWDNLSRTKRMGRVGADGNYWLRASKKYKLTRLPIIMGLAISKSHPDFNNVKRNFWDISDWKEVGRDYNYD